MRRIYRFSFLFTLFFAAAMTAIAQQPQTQLPPPLPPLEPLTKLEAMESQVGTVVVKSYTFIGSVSGLGGIALVTSYEFIDAQTGRKEYGIGVEVRETVRGEREGRTYVDYDEIDALVRGMDFIIKIDRSATLENFEAQYRTRGELAVSTFIRPNGTLQAEVAIGLFRRAAITISTGKLADFRKMIADAKTALDKIK